MFTNETVINVKAGNGGNGCFSFQREKYKPRGRPNGGSGGRGGNVYVKGSVNVHTLQDISYHRSYKAGHGKHGKGSNKDGENGNDIVIPIPIGTVILDFKTGDILYDCIKPGKNIIIAQGGIGGRGNAALSNQSNPNPNYTEYGKPGGEKKLRFSLKVLADVGLVGRPNAGKSTFLSSISNAHPKIADYPFTTTYPTLGLVKLQGTFDSFVVADIPGLIEDAHKGKGLGFRFLKHIERTRVLAVMVEATSYNPKAEAEMLINELSQYNPLLSEKPKCFLLTKSDLVPEDFLNSLPGWLPISSVTGTGVKEALTRMKKLIDEAD